MGGQEFFLLKHKGGPTLFWGKNTKISQPPPPQEKMCLPLVCAGLKTDTCSFGTFSLMIVHKTQVATFYTSFLYFALSLSMHRALTEQVKQSKYCLFIYKLYIYIFFSQESDNLPPLWFSKCKAYIVQPPDLLK